jgi:hypothetical protein
MNIDHLRALLSGERQEPVVVGHIYDPALMSVIGVAKTHEVLLSPETVVKQRRQNPDIGLEEYYILPDAIRYGMVAQEYAEQLLFCYDHHTGRRFLVVVETTLEGKLFVVSFHRTRPRQTKAILDRASLLRKHA